MTSDKQGTIQASSRAKQLLVELQVPIKYMTGSTSLFRHGVTPDKTTNAFRRLYLIHLHLDLHLSLTVSKDVVKEPLSGTVVTDTDYYFGPALMLLLLLILCRGFSVHVNHLVVLSL